MLCIKRMRSLLTATKSSPYLPQLESTCVQQRRPSAAKNKQVFFLKKVGPQYQIQSNTDLCGKEEDVVG